MPQPLPRWMTTRWKTQVVLQVETHHEVVLHVETRHEVVLQVETRHAAVCQMPQMPRMKAWGTWMLGS